MEDTQIQLTRGVNEPENIERLKLELVLITLN